MATVNECLQTIHILLEKTTDYPESTEEDYIVRLALLNGAVRKWETEEGMLWNELFVSLADAGDGDTETESGVGEYDAPSDFRFPVGMLRLSDGTTSSYFNLVPPSNVQTRDNDTTSSFWYVTGNASTGYSVHIRQVPTATSTINYEYYKSASNLTTGTDVLEMSDPDFAVYWVLSELISEDDPNLAQKYYEIASSKMRAMKIKNLMAAPWQTNRIDDYFQGFEFGK